MERARKGFTLIELMIVVMIIGLLSAVALPKFRDMLLKSKEGQTKGALSSLRSAVSSYYSSEEGRYPETLDATMPRYIEEPPKVVLGQHHGDSTAILAVAVNAFTAGDLTDAGGWVYTSASGAVAVNCTHTDTKGTDIYSW